MKKMSAFRIASLCTIVMVCAAVLSTQPAKAIVDANKKKLVPCSVQSGGVITKIGDTCDSGGEGCTPNPCD